MNEFTPKPSFPICGLEGRQTRLLPFVQADITPVYLGWLNDERVTRFSNQRFRRHDTASSMAYLATFNAADNLFLSVRRKEDGAAIGTMTAYVFRHHGTVDLGLLVGDIGTWGRGYGQDAWDALLNWLLQQGARKVTAGAAAGNRGMVTIMERSGMQLEATRKAQEIIDGQPDDVVYYACFSAA